MIQNVLITGGAGYIGSHIVVELLNSGYDVIIADNFSNSSPDTLTQIGKITGKQVAYYKCDVRNASELRMVFGSHRIDAVIHCAGHKAPGESVFLPLKYYSNNINCTITLLEIMREFTVRNLVFSSSASVYGTPAKIPVDEEQLIGSCANPYATSKLFSELIIRDTEKCTPGFSAVLLRYFNPVGAHSSGLIGELPNGVPNNLMPYLTRVAAGKMRILPVYGDDYPTRDGTGIRDYIHICDLARGHASALEYCEENSGAEAINLGTGKGLSVFELIRAFEHANDIEIPYQVVARRAGDVAESIADVSKAKRMLNWETQLSIDDMCRDAWNWERHNTI